MEQHESQHIDTEDNGDIRPFPSQQNKPKKERFMKKGWDYGLSIILLIVSIVAFYFIYKLAVLPTTWLWILLVLELLLNLIFLIWTLLRCKKWVIWTRRVCILLLCGLLGYGTVYINDIQVALEDITTPETTTTVNISLLSLKAGNVKHLNDLKGKKVGIQNANDKVNSDYVKEQLSNDSELDDITYVEDIDYTSLYKKLLDGEIDALIITDYYYKSLLRDTYPTILDDIFLLKSYQKQKEVDVSTSEKDIRYEPFTVFLGGVDEGDDPSINGRNDVNIVLIVNPLANQIKVVSIPRDSYVPNPALGFGNDKLTHLGNNGVENTAEAMEEVFGLEIDYYVKLNFFSVIEIIDTLDGVDADVPLDFCEQDENRSFDEENLICLTKGQQHLNGKQALAFARHRKSYGDIERGMAQQQIIKGVIDKLTTPAGAAKINSILKIAPKYISTNMPMSQVTNFVSHQLDNLTSWSVESIVLSNGSDANLITASMPSMALSVYILNRLDVQNVYDIYQQMLNQMQFTNFSFDLNNLSKDKKTLPVNNRVLWAGQDTSRYQPKVETPVVDENEEDNLTKPNTGTTPPKTDPTTPSVTPPVTPPATTPETPSVTPPVTPPVTDPSKPENGDTNQTQPDKPNQGTGETTTPPTDKK